MGTCQDSRVKGTINNDVERHIDFSVERYKKEFKRLLKCLPGCNSMENNENSCKDKSKFRCQIHIIPITPHANRPPAFPVVLLSSTRKLVQFTLAQIVRIRVNNNSSTDHRVGSIKTNQKIIEVEFGDSIFICCNISKITNMSFFVLGSAMRFLERVKMWPCTDAPVCGIAELMNVKAVLTRTQIAHFAIIKSTK
ncbi:hypothetical protein BpHYR1_004422 [Brachionus plicatilis]|uniref:Uncharacterized protein n=1 Tax=Brachionus plicatilis TaxID=10195 RepID=A0A3M7T449_BRAPC|nr:hypothetical protein BpHYR1_004422 [Brachionus plicatilis]